MYIQQYAAAMYQQVHTAVYDARYVAAAYVHADRYILFVYEALSYYVSPDT